LLPVQSLPFVGLYFTGQAVLFMRKFFLFFILLSNVSFSERKWDRNQLLQEGLQLLDSDPVKALGLLERAYYVGFPEQSVLEGLRGAYHKVILTALDKKDFSGGLQKAEDALLKFPNAFEFLKYRMIFAKEQQNYNLCIFYGREIEALTGKNDEINYLQGFSFHRLKAYRSAIEKLSTISHRFPGYRNVLVMLGDGHYHRGDFDKAMQFLKKAQEINKTSDVEQLIAKIQRESAIEKNYIYSAPSPHFRIRTTEVEMEESEEFLTPLLEGAYAEFVTAFQFHPETPVTVIVYGAESDANQARLGMPDWAAGVYDGELRIPVTEIKEKKQKLEVILRHELVHLFIDSITRNAVPVWFNEGCAQYYEAPFVFSGEGSFSNRYDAPDPAGFREITTEALNKNLVLTADVLGSSFMSLPKEKVMLAYAQSLYSLRYFVYKYGVWKLQRLLRAVYDGGLFEVVFREETGRTVDEFFREWAVFQKDLWKLP
jgi:tetratricopeptide (TPR) repeat protein